MYFDLLFLITLDSVVGIFAIRFKLSIQLLYLSLHFFHLNAILLRLILSVTTGMCEEILGCFGHSGELLLHDSVLELLVATVLLAKDVTAER